MKRLRLEIEDLCVESFETDSYRARRGTVHAHESLHCEGTEYTHCWGLCGGGGDSAAITCGNACASEQCTMDPNAVDCLSYAVQCPGTFAALSCGTCGQYCETEALNCTDLC